jgi:hypothetical protein
MRKLKHMHYYPGTINAYLLYIEKTGPSVTEGCIGEEWQQKE